MDISGQLKELRITAHITQEQLAERLMTTTPTICKIEKGMRRPDQDLIVDWASVCLQRPVKFIYERGIDGSKMMQLV